MKILLSIIIAGMIFLGNIGVFAAENLKTGNITPANNIQNDHLNSLSDSKFFSVGTSGEKGIYYTLINIAKSMKGVFFFLAGIYILILVLRILLADKTEEEINRYKNGIIWMSIGLILMQISFSIVSVLYDESVSGSLAANLINTVINPLINLLETGASVFFIGMAIYSFYKIVTANGNDETASAGKKSVIYSIGGYIIIKFARALVASVYGTINCNSSSLLGGLIKIQGQNCVGSAEISTFAKLIVQIINWANAFVGIVVIIMIVYAGFQVLISAGDEEKLESAKKSILYIAIGIGVLVLNFLILTFFIFPESAI